jgi:hypothetical protein
MGLLNSGLYICEREECPVILLTAEDAKSAIKTQRDLPLIYFTKMPWPIAWGKLPKFTSTTMTRIRFVILMFLPLLLIIPLLTFEMGWQWQIAILVFAILYSWIIQFLRLRFLGFRWNQCLLAFFTRGFGKVWWKVWEKDPSNN